MNKRKAPNWRSVQGKLTEALPYSTPLNLNTDIVL